MTRILLTFILLMASLPVLSAAPVASMVASRTTGTAPLCVHFDATGSTDADTTRPFHDLLYRWTFGNPSAGVWTKGSNASWPKNQARGAVAAHCYETPGTYTARLQVCDSTTCSAASTTITVSDPNTTFSGTNTICIANSLPTAGSGGCPSGAAVAAFTDFVSARTTHVATGKRLLFKRGDTFTATTAYNTGAATNVHLAAYGAGADPIVNYDMASSPYLFNFNTAGTLDWVINGFDFRGPGVANRGQCFRFPENITRLTIINTKCNDDGRGNGAAGTARVTEFFSVNNEILNFRSGIAWYLFVTKGALLGDTYGTIYGMPAEHGVRLQHAYKTVVSFNEFRAVTATKAMLTIRSYAHTTGATWNADTDTQLIVVSDNKLDNRDLNNGNNSSGIGATPTSNNDCHWGRDIVIERNFIGLGTNSLSPISIKWPDVTVRNNIVLSESTADGRHLFVSPDQDGTCAGSDSPGSTAPADLPPTVTRTHVYNNTFYTPTTYGGSVSDLLQFSTLVLPVTDPIVRNNLAYVPNFTGTSLRWPKINTTTNPTTSNNTTDTAGGNQIKNTSPQFASATPTTPRDFRIATASYGTAGGIAQFPATVEDFFLCRDRTGANRIGALVPAARAQCAGTAGAP